MHRSGARIPGIASALVVVCCLLGATRAHAARVFLNPSNQWSNPVCGGGNEADYALDVANRARTMLEAVGHTVIVDQDFTNAPGHANAWGADVFVSIHSNAGGGHGIETLYSVSGDIPLAADVNAGLIGVGGHSHVIDRGIKLRTNLYVLNNTFMPACLTEMLFHDCCPVEAPFLQTAGGRDVLATGIRNGVCAYLGGCQVCTPGTTQSQPCPECGTRSRTCNGAGQWGGWSACGGGGDRPCAVTNQHGTCDGIQLCSTAGTWQACQAPTPEAEVCDGLDNDCNLEIDDGDPTQLGASAPVYGAALVDLSYPQSLPAGGTALVWAVFENVGTATWPARELWLVAQAAREGVGSDLWPGGAWPAWDVPTTIGRDVAPGEQVLLAFDVRAPDEPGLRVTESFRLYDPSGEELRCPSPELTIELRVDRRDEDPESPSGDAPDRPSADASAADGAQATAGCHCGARGGRGAASLALLALLLLLLAWRRR